MSSMTTEAIGADARVGASEGPWVHVWGMRGGGIWVKPLNCQTNGAVSSTACTINVQTLRKRIVKKGESHSNPCVLPSLLLPRLLSRRPRRR